MSACVGHRRDPSESMLTSVGYLLEAPGGTIVGESREQHRAGDWHAYGQA